jgi:hypothetical protein
MSIRKKQKVRRFYVPESWEETLDTLEEILKREGSNLSKWIRQNGDHYVRLHEPGNPQQRLDMILKLGKAYHAEGPICGFKDCLRDAVGVGLFIPEKRTVQMCPLHLGLVQEDHRNWKILDYGHVHKESEES